MAVSEEEEVQRYSWKVSKLSSKHGYDIMSMAYHRQKSYLYLLASQAQPNSGKVEKCLWVYDLRRECLLMSPEIKPNSSKSQVEGLWATEEATEVYIFGSNYFRFWTISFNEKVIKESNYRNIERSIGGKAILRMYDTHAVNNRRLAVLTESQLLLLRRNELEGSLFLPMDTLKQGKNKENIEVELENSLNQIYKMKFMFDGEEQEVVRKETMASLRRIESQQEERGTFYCASELWTGEGCECFMVASRAGALLTYSLTNGIPKLINEHTPKKRHSFELMTTCRRG